MTHAERALVFKD